METVVYKTVGGLAIGADVYPGEGQTNAPVLVWIHGGALIMGNRRSLHPALSGRCAESGFAHISIDYRLAPETKLPAIIEDLRDAFHWIGAEGSRRFKWDSRRVAVIGHSGGGYLALMTGIHVTPRPKAIISYYGYGDIAGTWYSEPDPFYCQSPAVPKEEAYAAVGGPPLSADAGDKRRWFFYLYCRQNGVWPNEVTGIDPHTAPKSYDAFCPVRKVTKDFPPTFLAHGTDDTDVPYQLSVDMAAALERGGVAHEFITIPGGPHGFDGGVKPEDLNAADPSPAARCILRTTAFLVKHA